ncbi:PREDICTED: uncharacterized protein LOC109592301 [Amphimedon queenslandica]|uniref:Uncharacterized protein n=1 Tax=Amphimedon queenslandica TaxID=400682 RepID=A0A1X7SMV5_AMPQE|nr:PREDICTED: uncharacterized protein LOC109592301 [Amphimedon queenslandica]|eukprot:XP_019863345.1 PREDICTED: uncharacterized protein LOC109592301 [Amphimedon queenslandica]
MSSLVRKLSKKTSHSTQEAVIRLTNVAHTPSSSASPPPPPLPTAQPYSSLLLVRPSTRSNTKLSDKTKTEKHNDNIQDMIQKDVINIHLYCIMVALSHIKPHGNPWK